MTTKLSTAVLNIAAAVKSLLDSADAAAMRAATGAAASGSNSDITSFSGGPLAGLRNRLINGNFKINQRAAASVSTVYGAGAYVMDRWKAGAGGCTLSWATSGADVIVTITAGTLVQVVEDLNVEGGVYRLSNQGTAQARIAVNGAVTSGAYAATPLSSASATALQAVTVEFTTGTLDRVQLEPGTVATTFERRPYGLELALCQRYYYKRATQIIQGYNAAGFPNYRDYHHPVSMRTAPTIAFANATASNSSTVGVDGTPNSESVRLTQTISLTGTGFVTFDYTAAAEL